MNTCILLSTCDKYIPLAELTIELLGRRWKNHPPIFVCGVSAALIDSAGVLPRQSSPTDWVGITASAVDALLEKGYRKCYLILEDHPPLDVCNEMHLNETLPGLMDQLGAAYIGMYGWDQGTFSVGQVLSPGYHRLQRQEGSFSWRFSLHPALWDLEALRDLTRALPLLQNNMTTRSVWAFERRSGALKEPRWRDSSYRVFGAGMLAGKYGPIRAATRRLYIYLLNAFLWLVGKTLGVPMQERISQAALPDRLFFDGPYPLYWSGVLQKGRLNQNFEKFLLRRKRTDELDDFRRVIGRFGA